MNEVSRLSRSGPRPSSPLALRDELARASLAWWAGLEGTLAFTATGGVLVGHGSMPAGVVFLIAAVLTFAGLAAAHEWRDRLRRDLELFEAMTAEARRIVADAQAAFAASGSERDRPPLIVFPPFGGSYPEAA